MLRQLASRVPFVDGAVHRFDAVLGRRRYLDSDTLSHHRWCEGEFERIRRETDYRAGANVQLFRAEDLRDQGYVLLPDLFPSEFVERLQLAVTEALDDPRRIIPRQKPAADGNQYSWYLADVASIPDAARLLHPGLVSALEAYYGAYLRINSLKCWRNLHIPDEVAEVSEVYSDRWHFDTNRAAGLIKLFYLVHDVTSEDGPFHLQARPRTRELLRMGYGDRRNPRLSRETLGEGAITLVAPAGTVMLANTTTCLHRSSSPGPGRYRDLIQFQLLPWTVPLEPGWLDDPHFTRISARETRPWDPPAS
jgi:hypothetical protein